MSQNLKDEHGDVITKVSKLRKAQTANILTLILRTYNLALKCLDVDKHYIDKLLIKDETKAGEKTACEQSQIMMEKMKRKRLNKLEKIKKRKFRLSLELHWFRK